MIIGQYKVLGELGAGGMGIVYHAVDTMLEREVAMKKLRSEFSRSPDVAERFRREAKIQARLNHPNLAHLYNFFKEGDSFYIAMEFVEGAPLGSLLPLPWKQALPLFVQILDSLEYAHSLDVLHRDIKPDNIMVSPRGEVKVMDFGIAHVLGSVRQTREKTIVGTLEYISPEQISNQAIGAWSDIYSLGALLFEVISGRLPYHADSEFALLQCHLQSPVPDLRSVSKDAPAFLSEAVSKALAKSPGDRFPSCKAMADFLRQSAPEVFLQAAASSRRGVTNKEIDRCIQRIDSLLGEGEIELASAVADRAQRDYPDQVRLIERAGRVAQERNSAARSSENNEKAAFVRLTIDRLAEMESSGNFAAALDLINTAIAKEPRIPGLQVLAAYIRKKNPSVGLVSGNT